MKTEKILISFIAVVIGIIAAGVAFYFYQSTKTIPSTKTKIISAVKPTPTPQDVSFLTIADPKDEDVVEKRTIRVAGKTDPNAVIIVSTDSTDVTATPTIDGSFSTTITIDEGENVLTITAMKQDGTSQTEKRTVTYSTENF